MSLDLYYITSTSGRPVLIVAFQLNSTSWSFQRLSNLPLKLFKESGGIYFPNSNKCCGSASMHSTSC